MVLAPLGTACHIGSPPHDWVANVPHYRSLVTFISATAFALLGATALGVAQDASSTPLDAASQAQLAAARKIIPALKPDILAGAKMERELNLYMLGYDFKSALFPEFQKLFPFIKITAFEATINELLQRYAAEARSGRAFADVLMSSIPTALDDFDKEGLLTRYTPTSADHFKVGSRDGAYYPISRVQLCNAYNADRVSPADAKLLETWNGIANPRWQAKAGMVRFGVGANGLLSYYFMYTHLGPDYLKRVAALKPLVFTSLPVLTERLAAGGVDAMFFANDGNLQQLKSQGAPIQWVCPDPGLVLFTSQILGFHARNPNAGKLWIEFLMSDLGQELVMKTLHFAPGRTDIKDIREVASEPWYRGASTVFEFTWGDVMARRAEVQAKWDAVSSDVRSRN
jgi:iron(III) transport system substrate-binding protein